MQQMNPAIASLFNCVIININLPMSETDIQRKELKHSSPNSKAVRFPSISHKRSIFIFLIFNLQYTRYYLTILSLNVCTRNSDRNISHCSLKWKNIFNYLLWPENISYENYLFYGIKILHVCHIDMSLHDIDSHRKELKSNIMI